MWRGLCPHRLRLSLVLLLWKCGSSRSADCVPICVAHMFTSARRSGEVFPRRRTSFAQLPLIAQRARGGAQQFANELGGPGLSAVEQNTTNSAEDSLQVSRAPLLDWAMQTEVGLEIIEICLKNILRLPFMWMWESVKWLWMLSSWSVELIYWRGIFIIESLCGTDIFLLLKSRRKNVN